MYAESFFLDALVYLATAVVTVPIAKRLGLGSVLGYLLGGILIGPFALGFVGAEGQDVLHFAEFGVVLMLFVIGLELEPARVWRMRGPILGLGGLQVLATSAALTGLAIWAGVEWRSALAIGLALSLSSTAIVLQTLDEKGLMHTAGGQSAFAVLLFQDIAVIPMLAAFPLLAVHAAPTGSEAATEHASVEHGSSWVAGLGPWEQVGAVLGAVVAIVVVGRYGLRPIFRAIAASGLREVFTAAALLLVIGIALLMTKVGLSPALGTFLAGVVLANSEFRHELESDIEPFKGLLLGLFFIAVGTSIDFELIGAELGTILGLVAGLVVVKLVVLHLLGRLFRLGLDQNLLFSFGLAQGGEFAFVLTSFALSAGVLSETLAGRVIAVVALSMALAPVLMLFDEKVLRPRTGTRESGPPRATDVEDQERRVVIAGYGRFGEIVGRVLSAGGVRATVLDVDSDQVDLLRRLGFEVFYGDATRHDLLAAAGAARAELLVVAVDDPERAASIVDTARKHFPHLRIFARTRGRVDAQEFMVRGVDDVYRETLDSALRMGSDALNALGTPAHQALRTTQAFRRHEEKLVRELAEHRHERQIVDLARRRIADVEATLEADARRHVEPKDAGWDTTSLARDFAARPDGDRPDGDRPDGDRRS
ncbi:Glutathione-regulated potassium-efflux system protein KefC [Planctomycetes bacterium Pla163]|uniref:Glutathione-regulated potassium-efflux system protein KefC n=1 Tax=Rohdeia mirabilis TaxID=2528008 RepID=A0A518CZN9_9BACT|nr:Glutathione-regulated potassium-efflux system protein KefC [Planctomycetes bacterium Pla163]